MTFALVLVAALVVLAAWEWVRIVVSVYQSLLERLDWSSRDTSRPASPPQGDHDEQLLHEAHSDASSRGHSLSSPYVLAVPLAAIDPAPNMSAFGAGLELIVFTVLFAISALLVVNWIIKTIKGSD